MERFLIIADDFTGANDTGVQFAKRGIPTQVVFKTAENNSSEHALVIDTETRGMSGQDAYKAVKKHCIAAQVHNFTGVYKKVDSTLRGNISEEIKAVFEVYKPEITVFAPAYPSNYRTTVNGIQHMKGMPVSSTEVGRDPKKPVVEDNITALLKKAINTQVSHISLEYLRSGTLDISLGGAFTFDAEEKEDLIKIVERVKGENKKTLWIGSAGLAEALMEIIIPAKPVLCIVGSISEVSRKQVEYAAAKGADVVKVDTASILKGSNISKIVEEAVASLRRGRDTVLVSSYTREDYEECVRQGYAMGMAKEEVSLFTQSTLAELVEQILRKETAAGLFLTGGDTAVEVIQKLGANGSKILQELKAGIPLMRLLGGHFEGLAVVTKAGAFGEEDALHYCIGKIKEAN
jgi:D-threonate/D-erythronate kinase